jgi:diaminohydroxyphosphoribosylaminopyrimidine deaminase/5-amino-6-(5-phosphoribosylamino)uracil reductase
MLKEATLYVTLEPCCHHGKTPPCTDLILESGIPKVVLGIQDPHEKVGGMGIEKLREGGCQVETRVLEGACREHHRRFLNYHEKKRPYIILKWAQSADGFFAPAGQLRGPLPEPFWISGKASRQLVHQWRSEESAILVGTRTALEDNPRLDTRLWKGRSPLRVLIDRHLKVPGHYHLLDGSLETLVFCDAGTSPQTLEKVRYKRLDPDSDPLKQILDSLWQEQVLSLLVEGGARTLNRFIASGLWDEARIIEGPSFLGAGLRAPTLQGTLIEDWHLENDRIRIVRND